MLLLPLMSLLRRRRDRWRRLKFAVALSSSADSAPTLIPALETPTGSLECTQLFDAVPAPRSAKEQHHPEAAGEGIRKSKCLPTWLSQGQGRERISGVEQRHQCLLERLPARRVCGARSLDALSHPLGERPRGVDGSSRSAQIVLIHDDVDCGFLR